uniref:Uncharacterized protein n=1 Tax=Rhinopithecus roxellana TaxID=61622 RepID=A0A2K6NPS2_RHIRO
MEFFGSISKVGKIRRRSCGARILTRKPRSSTQKKRNTRLQSSARLIRKLWTHKFYQKSKLFLSSRATCDLCLP